MKKSPFYILLLLVCYNATGQNNTCNKVWKKEVSRVIETGTIHNKTKIHDSKDKSLVGQLIASVKEGKITAYSVEESGLNRKMTMAGFNRLVDTRTDTGSIIDPVSGKVVVQYTQRNFHSDYIHKYRITEEWTFNPGEGKIDVQIAYIAPLTDIFGDDSIYRGTQSIFRISFKDFSDIMKGDKENELKEFMDCVWQSNFKADSSIPVQIANPLDEFSANATMLIDMSEPEDTIHHFLRNEHEDSTLSDLAYSDIMTGKIHAWHSDDHSFNKEIAKDDFIKMQKRGTDTNEVFDPIANVVLVKITQHNIDYEYINHYLVFENWSLNVREGKTGITIKVIAPTNYYYSQKEQPLFWVKYKDVQPIMEQTEQYHPTNTFAMHIWDALFLSPDKPVVVR